MYEYVYARWKLGRKREMDGREKKKKKGGNLKKLNCRKKSGFPHSRHENEDGEQLGDTRRRERGIKRTVIYSLIENLQKRYSALLLI